MTDSIDAADVPSADPGSTSARGETEAHSRPPRLVLFDGRCGLCDRTVQWLLDHDPEGVLRFAPLQGDTAAAIRARHPELPAGLDSILFVENDEQGERVYWRSRAVFRLVRHLPGPVRRLAVFRFVPPFLTDIGYRFVAAIRYRVFGTRDACRVPTPAERGRFLA